MKNKMLPEDLQNYVKKYYIKTWLLFLGLFVVFGLILFFFGERLFGVLLPWQRILIYSLVMVSTVFLSRLPGKLFNHTFMGKVESVRVKTTYVDINYRGNLEPPPENHIVLLIVTPEGKKIRKRVYSVELKTPNKVTKDDLPKHNMDVYQKGDEVLHLAGTSYTMILPKPSDTHVMCAVCGEKNKVEESTCKHCGYTLIKKIETI